MSKENGGMDKVRNWSRLFLVPGMGHCSGGTATVDGFDMLTTIVDWVENGKTPEYVTAKSRQTPSRSRPLCAYPAHAEYLGTGDPQNAANFVCR
jgi:feruloyl esterase